VAGPAEQVGGNEDILALLRLLALQDGKTKSLAGEFHGGA